MDYISVCYYVAYYHFDKCVGGLSNMRPLYVLLNWLDKYAEYKDIEMDSKITNCSSIALLIDYKDIKNAFSGR